MCAKHVQQLGGGSPLHIRMGRSDSEAQGRHREVGSGGTKTRADGQESDMRHTAPDEPAYDSEVRIHQGRRL
jgi:hypothetical protein